MIYLLYFLILQFKSFQRFYLVWYIINTYGPSHNISKENYHDLY